MSAEVQRILSEVQALSAEEQAEFLSFLGETLSGGAVENAKRQVVLEVRGKYAHVLTSSEEFIKRKQEELELEH
jgi:hypothetical protein